VFVVVVVVVVVVVYFVITQSGNFSIPFYDVRQIGHDPQKFPLLFFRSENQERVRTAEPVALVLCDGVRLGCFSLFVT
jgi:hypothetical protein